MENESKYVCIDNSIVNKSILLLNKILHTVKTFKLDNFYFVIDNDPTRFTVDSDNKIIDIADDVTIYLACKVTKDDGTEMFEIIDIIDDEIEYQDDVIKKYDILSFTLNDIECKGMALGFNECSNAIYIETLVNIDNELSIIYLYLNEDSNVKVIEPMDQDIIDAIIDKLD